jgi:acetyl esterase/lipase
MGFSTGGQLTAMASHRFDAGKPDATDPVERVSSRPDFTILIYPANIRTVGEIAKDAPPAFLLCTYGDNNPATQVPEFFLALKKANIPAELHVYGSGPHGFGLREKPQGPFPSTETWYLRVTDWMGDRGLLKKQ